MHGMNGTGRQVVVPGQVSLGIVLHDTDLAQSSTLTLTKPGNVVEMHIFGGLSKVEDMASRIAGGMTDGRLIDPIDEDIDRIAKQSVRIAKAILAECNSEPESIATE